MQRRQGTLAGAPLLPHPLEYLLAHQLTRKYLQDGYFVLELSLLFGGKAQFVNDLNGDVTTIMAVFTCDVTHTHAKRHTRQAKCTSQPVVVSLQVYRVSRRAGAKLKVRVGKARQPHRQYDRDLTDRSKIMQQNTEKCFRQ